MGSFKDSYSLIPVADLPAPFRAIFNFRYFNSLQSECLAGCFLSDINMVISAPTGSGKTVLFQLCILRLMSKFLSSEGKLAHIKGTLKTIYIAPSKALVQEKLRDWNMKFGPLGINCLEMTGDNESYKAKNIQEVDIILSTPEKFDAVTRHGARNGDLSFFSDIALVLIDEVHLLNEPRGAALEAIVSRIKMLSRISEMSSSPLAYVRFLAVSATIPNIQDIAEWLLVQAEGIKRFGEEMRPVQLTTKVFGYAPAKNDFLFERRLQNFIFVGYHNGGLCMKDRNLVEGLFLKGDLMILCTTNTLAHGINLPAHTVVIKSTQYFNKEKGLYMEYERSMVLQMCGRAGRPPFDETGTAIIMTRRGTVHLYENLLNGCEMVESQLLSCAMEHLMAEIVQLTVSDISLAIEWLKCSYLYVRIKKNPENYGIKRGIPHECLEKHMQEICVKKIKELSEHGMIWTDEDGFLLKPLEPGRLMTKFYLKFNTMKLIVKAPGSCSVEDVLHIISHSEELSWIQLRRNEKKLLNDINSDKEGRLRFHVLSENGKRKKRIQTREEKIFVLANDCLTGDPLVHDLSLNQDMNSICMSGCRIAKCMKECFIYRKNYRGTISSTLLAKCLHHKLWENSPYLLKQLPGIGMVTAKVLRTAGINSFESMAAADPRKLEIITGRKYPFGNHVKESLLLLPAKVEIKIKKAECKKPGKLKLMVTLNRTWQSVTSTKHHYADILVGSDEDNMILFHEKIRAEEFPSPYLVTVLVSCPQKARVTIKADLIFEEFVGLDVHEKLVLTKEINLPMTKGLLNEDVISSYSLPEEIYVIEDDQKSSSRVICDESRVLHNWKRVQSSMPSFDLLQEETGTDVLAPEPRETECKTKSEELIFHHIRKKSKTFPTLSTSMVVDYSFQPLALRRDVTPKKQGFEIEADLNNIILIDSEPSEASQEPSVPISFPTETEEFLTMSSGSISNILKSEFHHKLSTTYCRPGYKKPSCNDLLKKVQTAGCKRSLPNESNPVSARPECSQQHHSVSALGNQREESFLGFKSVFSFL